VTTARKPDEEKGNDPDVFERTLHVNSLRYEIFSADTSQGLLSEVTPTDAHTACLWRLNFGRAGFQSARLPLILTFILDVVIFLPRFSQK
jgi:hypothetical protein